MYWALRGSAHFKTVIKYIISILQVRKLKHREVSPPRRQPGLRAYSLNLYAMLSLLILSLYLICIYLHFNVSRGFKSNCIIKKFANYTGKSLAKDTRRAGFHYPKQE